MKVASKLAGLTMLAIASLSVWFAFQAQEASNQVFIERTAVTQGR